MFSLGDAELFVVFSESCDGEPKDGGPVAQARVLVADGEYHTRKILRGLLLAQGCSKIHEAGDAKRALEAIQALGPDVVLLDWKLPGTGGASFVRQLRGAGFAAANVPIIILLGREERSRVLEAVRLGVHEFLLKPISTGALKARLLSALSSRSSAAPSHDRQPSNLRKLAS